MALLLLCSAEALTLTRTSPESLCQAMVAFCGEIESTELDDEQWKHTQLDGMIESTEVKPCESNGVAQMVSWLDASVAEKHSAVVELRFWC